MNGQSTRAPAGDIDPLKDPAQLAAANINPVTGLSTDYLNHFSEAIMLLDLVPHAPECRAELARWQPKTYRQHFAASDLKHRDLTIAAYDLANATTRQQFDATCEAINATILDARAALHSELPMQAGMRLVTDAMGRLKPLFAHASAIIHGLDSAAADRCGDSGQAVAAEAVPAS